LGIEEFFVLNIMSFYHSWMSQKFQRRTLFMKQFNGRSWKAYVIYLLTCIALVYGDMFLWPVVPGISNIADGGAYKVKIAPQSGLAAISQQLSAQGITSHPLIFQLAARATFVGGKLKPGTPEPGLTFPVVGRQPYPDPNFASYVLPGRPHRLAVALPRAT
jgi:hypothetical protein